MIKEFLTARVGPLLGSRQQNFSEDYGRLRHGERTCIAGHDNKVCQCLPKTPTLEWWNSVAMRCMAFSDGTRPYGVPAPFFHVKKQYL